ncbi:RNA polymerase sigma-70 factor (ECF subfamily) [Rhizobium leguminosarum]|uniref:RNA polymerase sigma-70 factor (ECF subfamily) n=1 Tax=Rhizobium leguminosarum TaxID=384 RepID=A0AAE2MLV2_RHILE|nr:MULTISPECIES: RNA polymerase sigma factor [Rhizobium]MBB4291495.1 RNA polymerase sigma-70 factor (ECF subfamily) [Rhizobium leguminosarum]MBB4296192.1 RNA polymerase sigma-70 factor (ECF subfamily) [Rhizobium leguminosarum]MBB4308549.1 RNA polymerase sigma-70 factor (ECF subfamily) [Rhizobium leguminosarum]MBB4416384.1 RNA polymerase sigma-70 factor (ECF subfamily) [Rhizobium leguminosarum]MBB4430649.1 RNA polymerase sigma-70 factor (ECF subfamily) [Rhizobium esperanzae]
MDDLITQVEPMIPALRRYARSLCGDTETADDIVQDCLEKVVANWSLRRADNARSWVFSILHNLAINKLKRRSRWGRQVQLEDMPTGSDARQASQDETLFSKEVLAALEFLPEDHRSILLLISVEGLTYSEAAEVLAVPVGTVMSRLSRARENLRTQLEKPRAGRGHPNLVRVK